MDIEIAKARSMDEICILFFSLRLQLFLNTFFRQKRSFLNDLAAQIRRAPP